MTRPHGVGSPRRGGDEGKAPNASDPMADCSASSRRSIHHRKIRLFNAADQALVKLETNPPHAPPGSPAIGIGQVAARNI